MMTTDEARLAQIQARCDRIIESLTLSNSREEVMPYLTAGAFPLDDLCFLLAQSAALRDQLARVAAALAVYANQENWSEADRENPYTGTWYREQQRQMQDVFIPRGDGWEGAQAALAARTPTPGAAGEVG